MPDRAGTSPEAPPPLPEQLPEGPPAYLWFAGILEGRRKGAEADAALEAIVAELNGLRVGDVSLELDGGHFSILFSEQTLLGTQLDGARRDAFLGCLQRVADLCGTVESTVRVTEVYANQTAESMFAPVDGEMRSIGRLRATTPSDRQHAPVVDSVASEIQQIGKRRFLLFASLVLLLVSLVAWQQGLFGRMFAPDAATLQVELAGAKPVIQASVASSWGTYAVTVQRAAGYPNTPAERKALLDGAATTADQAMLRAIVDGDPVFVRLEDEQNKVLAASQVHFRELLAAADGKVTVLVPGRRGAHHVRLALAPGKRP